MIELKLLVGWGFLTVFAAAGLLAETPGHVQVFPLRDTTGLIAPKAKIEAASYL